MRRPIAFSRHSDGTRDALDRGAMRTHLLATVLGTLLMAGCAAEYGVAVAPATYGPDLVYVQPGVQVIADWNEPIFFVDGFYWRYYGNSWYRSTYYTGGWAYAPPPPVLMRVDRPHQYAHYRPRGWPAGRGPWPRRRHPPCLHDTRVVSAGGRGRGRDRDAAAAAAAAV
ncbi:MAG: hypothetical protein ACM31C_25655, partial [Acidobacteriota bacterium]